MSALTPLSALDRLTAAGWGDVRQSDIPAEVWAALRDGEQVPPCPDAMKPKGKKRGPKMGAKWSWAPAPVRTARRFAQLRKRIGEDVARVLGGKA